MKGQNKTNTSNCQFFSATSCPIFLFIKNIHASQPDRYEEIETRNKNMTQLCNGL